jgi:hypothetical protein
MAGLYSSIHLHIPEHFATARKSCPLHSLRSRILILTDCSKISRLPFSHKFSIHAGAKLKENMTTNNKPAFEIFVVSRGQQQEISTSPKTTADTTPT